MDNVRIKYPEDSIGYQLKQINKCLVTVFQLIVSITTGFISGFLGLELIFPNLDIRQKLLLGMACAYVTAVAALYFLLKRLNADSIS